MAGHLKRIAAPRAWKIKRKTSKWIVRPLPGAHSLEEGFSIATLLSEKLKVSKSRKEAKTILQKKHVLINGVRRFEPRFITGFMDLIELPDVSEMYRMVYDHNGFLKLVKETQKVEPVRIKNKTMKAGKTQLHLSDGRNITVEKDTYKVNDTVVLEIPSMKIINHLPLQEGMLAYLTGGSHVGDVGKIISIKDKIVQIKTEKETFETAKKSIFVIGKEKSVVTLV